MEGSGAVQNGQPSAAPPQQASLIRPEQVKKLPYLDQEAKARHEVGIQKLWDIINTRPANSPEQQQAYAKLGQISATLMNGMKQWNAKTLQAAQQAAQQNSTSTTSHASSNATPFEQLNPAIQARVNATQFIYPPAMTEGQPNAENWLREAKARFGQALQRSEMAKQRKAELQRNLAARQQAGAATAEDINMFNTKIQQCQKAIAESDTFMIKFREQQQSFRQQAQQAQQRFPNQGQPGLGETNDQPMLSNMPGNQPSQAPQGPTPHSISSAVSAARNQASAAPAATSPQAEQAQMTQAQNPLNGTPVSQHQPNPSPYNIQQSHTDVPGSATSQHQGPPRSLSHQALSHQTAMSQSAQSHAALQQQQQAQSAAHAHPPGYLNNPKKDDRQPITKNLQVAAPQAIAVPPARPTLNGGPGVGMPGQMGQPAIPSMPGYVLETSEDGRVLSKKKLQELVREVCGPGGDEQLTPEVEEVSTLSLSHLPRNPNHACHSPSNQTLLHTNHLCNI